MAEATLVETIEGQSEPQPPEDLPPDMTLPHDPRAVFLGGLFLLAVLAACWVAKEIVLPIVLAFVLKLLLQPAQRVLERVRVPRALGALLLIGVLFGVVVGFGTILSGPATHWATTLPEGLPRLQERLGFLRQPIAATQRFLEHAEGYVTNNGSPPAQGGAAPAKPAAAPAPAFGSQFLESLFVSTGAFVSGLFTTVLILFFLLMSGDVFLRRLVEILPRLSDKRAAVEISQRVEHDISAYLVTITIMNTLVGVATGLAMWACGMADPVLWGAVAFFLNYVPILGPAIGVVTFLFAGLLGLDGGWLPFLPAVLYLAIHLVEGETVTPMLLARRFTLNPVLVILSLIFWHWMWGVPGAVLAVPMLAILKIICDGIRPLAAFGHFLEG
jgi:predicted PurR-regulated permease PerM